MCLAGSGDFRRQRLAPALKRQGTHVARHLGRAGRRRETIETLVVRTILPHRRTARSHARLAFPSRLDSTPVPYREMTSPQVAVDQRGQAASCDPRSESRRIDEASIEILSPSLSTATSGLSAIRDAVEGGVDVLGGFNRDATGYPAWGPSGPQLRERPGSGPRPTPSAPDGARPSRASENPIQVQYQYTSWNSGMGCSDWEGEAVSPTATRTGSQAISREMSGVRLFFVGT